jgi:hypothetical protein
MAKRKHTKKRHHKRKRHSMGAVGGGMTTVLSMVAGAIAGKVISSKLKDKVNPKILAGGQIAAGLFLPKLVKNKFVAGLGSGMIVNGGVELVSSFGVISGIMGDEPSVEYIGEYDDDMMSGTDSLSTIAGEDYDGSDMGYYDAGTMSGVNDLSIISGSDDMEGYDY